MCAAVESFAGGGSIAVSPDPCAEFVTGATARMQAHCRARGVRRATMAERTETLLFVAHLLRGSGGSMRMAALVGTASAALHLRYDAVQATVDWLAGEGLLWVAAGVVSWRAPRRWMMGATNAGGVTPHA